MKILLSNNADSLRSALGEYSHSATVEAEYGEECVRGTVLTLAHHGARAGNPCPALHDVYDPRNMEVGIVGISHFDLDTLMGIGAIQGIEFGTFNELAAFVDTNGAHKLGKSGASDEDLRRLYAFWAWSAENRLFPPRDGSVVDVTEFIKKSLMILGRIDDMDVGLLEKGEDFKQAGEKLNVDSFCEREGSVLTRVSPSFVNHLYEVPKGFPEVCEVKAVVAYNPTTGCITVSLSDPIKGVSCREIVQQLWGPEAGGHDGIAGSPRGDRMSLGDLLAARELMTELLNPAAKE